MRDNNMRQERTLAQIVDDLVAVDVLWAREESPIDDLRQLNKWEDELLQEIMPTGLLHTPIFALAYRQASARAGLPTPHEGPPRA